MLGRGRRPLQAVDGNLDRGQGIAKLVPGDGDQLLARGQRVCERPLHLVLLEADLGVFQLALDGRGEPGEVGLVDEVVRAAEQDLDRRLLADAPREDDERRPGPFRGLDNLQRLQGGEPRQVEVAEDDVPRAAERLAERVGGLDPGPLHGPALVPEVPLHLEHVALHVLHVQNAKRPHCPRNEVIAPGFRKKQNVPERGTPPQGSQPRGARGQEGPRCSPERP